MKTDKSKLEEQKQQLDIHVVSGSLTHIPLFQYNVAVESHGNTLELLRIIQNDKKELKEELEATYKEIDRLKAKLNYC